MQRAALYLTGNFMIENNYYLYLIGFFGLFFILFLLWVIPKRQMKALTKKPTDKEEEEQFNRDKERLKLEDDSRKTLAQIIGGSFILLGVAVTYNTYILNINKQDLDREGQMTDRFSKAVTHLGDATLAVRLGGMYELERVAKDSKKDHGSVMEILASYIREKSPVIKNDQPSNSKENTAETREKKPLPIDIQVALTIIGRRTVANDQLPLEIDLSNCYLAGANLSRLDFQSTNFSGSDLSGVNFHGNNFGWRGRTLPPAGDGFSYPNTRFINADLSGANFMFANLFIADFSGANLTGADLSAANLASAQFENTNLSGAILPDSQDHKVQIDGVWHDVHRSGITLEQLKRAIINEETDLPPSILPHRQDLLIKSKENLEKNGSKK
jgi:hypothetical protein